MAYAPRWLSTESKDRERLHGEVSNDVFSRTTSAGGWTPSHTHFLEDAVLQVATWSSSYFVSSPGESASRVPHRKERLSPTEMPAAPPRDGAHSVRGHHISETCSHGSVHYHGKLPGSHTH